MTATATVSAPPAHSTVSAPPRSTSTKGLWRTGALAGLAASVATSAFAAGAHVLDVSLEVGGQAIPVIGFAQLTFVLTMIGALIAVVLSHRASRPRHTFVITTLALTALSIVPDALADAQTATRLTLALTHLIAAAIVIPAISSRLTD
jgi:peptidoglycan/LPS O-acetylase OafA/YrhL